MKKNNGWFMACGILSIITTVTLGLCIIFAALIPAMLKANADLISDYTSVPLTQEEITAMISTMYTLIIAMVIFAGMGIFNSIVYFKYMKKSFEETKKTQGLLITAIVFSFIGSGILVGIFGILGLNMAPTSEQSVEQPKTDFVEVKKETKNESVESKLKQLKELKDSGILSEEEYQNKKTQILNDL